MPTYYTYLISSLPMLHFGMKPPFSFERFLKNCRGFITEEDLLLLMNLPLTIDEYSKPATMMVRGESVRHPTIERWLAFDTALRNELVKIRAHSKKIEPVKYMRGESPIDQAISHTAMSSHRSTSILEAEKLLDEARWQALDDLGFGHYFDTGFLILYAYKLKVLERWEKMHTQDKDGLLEALAG
ncbi:MAG: DUF2764 family protein [Candidatus Omnitrophota bacterium]|nr:DUF2764 family protein [Candidatus Omnitrophota bacterium]